MSVVYVSFSFTVFLLVLSLFFYSSFSSWIVSFFPCSFLLNGLVEFTGCLDTTVIMCAVMLFTCSLLAFIYCFHYYYGVLEAKFLFYLMVWFVGVMLVLIMTGSLVFTLVMWEYLGFVSFLLILFYSNSSGVRASLVTLFSSRFGDVGLFVVLVYIMSGGSFSSWFFFFSFFLIVISKSAGFPFISWLLEAMRAPTPVSSLVHSSTLVAAGVWFIVRYGYLIDSSCFFFIFVVSLFTIFVTGVSALFFVDLKKIVALSTCNNVAWCLVYYVCGDLNLVIFQLLVHGVCKCALFILVGDLMSSSGGSQSAIGLYLSRYGGVYGCILLVFLVFCLCGLPFIGIYFSKHFFFSALVGSSYNIVLVLFVLLGFLLSYIYSFRLCLMVCCCIRGLPLGYLVSFLFVGVFVLLGSFFGWCILGLFEELSCLSFSWSVFFLFVQIVGCFFGYLFYVLDYSGLFWVSVLFGSDSLIGLFYYTYNLLVGLSLLVFYRWEVDLLTTFGYLLGSRGSGLFVFSLNFIILGVFFYVVSCLVF
uniref:NADH:ubiquinone reductase (H(+)-translocating) n=1 Tax=Tylodelphys immer TaxID=1702215 RepID=A0A6J3YU77_9TREM|nr:NADH dehydrogenase subunit 5 [Tylodelphys immer]